MKRIIRNYNKNVSPFTGRSSTPTVGYRGTSHPVPAGSRTGKTTDEPLVLREVGGCPTRGCSAAEGVAHRC